MVGSLVRVCLYILTLFKFVTVSFRLVSIFFICLLLPPSNIDAMGEKSRAVEIVQLGIIFPESITSCRGEASLPRESASEKGAVPQRCSSKDSFKTIKRRHVEQYQGANEKLNLMPSAIDFAFAQGDEIVLRG